MKSDGNLRKIFREKLPHAHWQPIETGAVGPGTPDSNFCFPGGIEGWIEFKFTKGWAVGLRPAQIGWLLRRARLGGRVFIGVRQRCADGDDRLWLVAGGLAADLQDKGLRGVPCVGRWQKGPSQWLWTQIEEVLKSQPRDRQARGQRSSSF